ncbi:MAG: metallophosphoesterase [Solirubrobacteraceae bacterium]
MTGAAAAAAALGAWSLWVEPRRLVVRRQELVLPAWPAALDGLRVGVMTDLHAGMPHAGLDALARATDVLQAERPDLICLLGDFIDRRAFFSGPIDADALAQRLAVLRAPRGVVAVLGNHDWYAGASRISAALFGVGIPVLEDDAQPAGDGLWTAGVGDYRIRGAHVGRALARVPANDAVLLLSHDPDVFPLVPARVALTLSGHTHGGQVGIPLLRRHFIPSHYGERFVQGHVEEDGRHLYVSSGLGTSGVPVRLLRPPEVVILTLRAPS